MSDQAFRFISINPVLSVNDLQQEITYYRDKLGFHVTWQWGEGEPAVRAGVSCGDLEIQLVSDGRFAPTHPSFVYVVMEGVDEYYAACVACGADVMMALDDRPFGVRDFRVKDLSGNAIGFGQAI